MAKFKMEDRVVSVKDDRFWSIYVGDVGTIVENESKVPYVLWDKNAKRIAVSEEDLKLYTDPASEIAQIVENSINSTEPIPIDRFEFRYSDEYGRELSHKFEQSEGDYNFIDVIASFRLFLLGVGYAQKDVDEIIREDRL